MSKRTLVATGYDDRLETELVDKIRGDLLGRAITVENSVDVPPTSTSTAGKSDS
ncbi:hypothetical protein [Haloferax sp. Atlit-4N]|uniref:hypothetical protein n=1 Tax=Haloferax sp. Atlit-4N TaxID=2077206 RepID=UPI0037449B56